MERAYRNLGFFFLALPLIFLAGFWIPYFSEIPRFNPSITTAVHIHALLLFAWVGLLVIQPLAIRSNAFSVHGILGKASYALMPLIIVFAIGMIHKEYQEHLTNGMNAVAAMRAEHASRRWIRRSDGRKQAAAVGPQANLSRIGNGADGAGVLEEQGSAHAACFWLYFGTDHDGRHEQNRWPEQVGEPPSEI